MALVCRAWIREVNPGAEPASLLAAIDGHQLPARVVTGAEAFS
jgi:hypothetical protein